MFKNKHYDFSFFLKDGYPLETRYGTSGQLWGLINELNKRGYKTCIITTPPIRHKRSILNKLSNTSFFANFLSNKVRRIHLKIDKKYIYKTRYIFLNKKFLFDSSAKLKLNVKINYLISWNWEAAYNLKKLNTNAHKIQILHYKYEPENLADYLKENELPLFKEMYYQPVDKLAISYTQVNELKSNYNICLWLQGISTELFTYDNGKDKKEDITILVPLRNHREKGPEYAIDVMKSIHYLRPEIKIIGYGDYKGRVPTFIYFKGRVSIEELIFLYKKASIFVIPSLSEGFSLPGLEAMASGCVVISTINGGSEQYILEHENGILVKYGDIEGMSGAILEVVGNNELREKIIRNGLETVKNYTYSKACDRFLEAIKSLECNRKNGCYG